MIKPNELRIGNLIQLNEYKNIVYSITSINDEVVTIRSGDAVHGCPISDIAPIPLTEDWLVKLGFKKHNQYNNLFFIFNSKFRYDTKNAMFEIMIPCSMDGEYQKDTCGGGVKINIKYVHQLQNLYFALTGQELTIKV